MSEQHALIVINPKTESQTVVIHVDQGTLWCTPNGGAVRAAQGSLVRWECTVPFTLSFQQLGGSHQPWRPIPSHPEAGDIQAVELKPRIPDGGQAPYYEYTVTVGSLTLDPIIIVDKS
ncbi:MAG TPA: hypothetical protein VL994_11800 [Steroidobacteraceae bacterium]|nr:hypothetical protein [Steroidobacteraceae bacterium]